MARQALFELWRARLRPYWRDLRPGLVLGCGVAVLVLGFIGWLQYSDDKGLGFGFWDAAYRALALFGFSAAIEPPIPLALQIARVLGPLIIGYAALQALIALFRQELQSALLRIFARDHVVVAGLGWMGFRLAAGLHAAGQRVVVIERDGANERIPGLRERGIAVLVGDATDPAVLERAQVGRARHLIVVLAGGAASMDCAVAAESLAAARRSGVLNVLVHLYDLPLWRALSSAGVGSQHSSFRLDFFNVYAMAARRVLEQHPAFTENAPEAHVVVVGLEGVGEQLVLALGGAWRNIEPGPEEPLPVTLAGPDAVAERERLLAEHEGLEELVALEALPNGLDEAGERATRAYVCLLDEPAGLTAALALAAHPCASDEPVVLAVADEDGGVTRVLSTEGRALDRVAPFGIFRRSLTADVLGSGETEILARAKHEDYALHEERRGRSVPPWDELPEPLRESNRRFADGISAKLSATGCVLVPDPTADAEDPGFAFSDSEVEELAIAEHERWERDLVRDGWRGTSGAKDPARRLHPLIGVPWDGLDEENRDRDREPVRAIPSMLARAGFRVVRTRDAAAARRPEEITARS